MPSPSLFSRGTWLESSRTAEILRRETVGGMLLLGAALIAILWANSPWADAYENLANLTFGPESLHLHLSLETWAADGLLAIFFFVVGLELKREFVAGDLRDPRRAALPIVAAVGGMIVPALIFVAVNWDQDTLRGWAIPTATDIAFAVAVLAVLSTHLPSALRTFLLTLAVVDDLLAITVIAIFYTESLSPQYLALAVVPIVAFALAVRFGPRTPWLLVPLAFAAWALMHASGVHATVAGVLLGFTVPAIERDDRPSIAEALEHRIRPISAGFAVPVFAFFAAGVTLGGGVLGDALHSTVTWGIFLGLVLGKPIGILGSSLLLSATTRASLDPSIRWVDVLGVSMLAGIGFTVSLLIGDLAYPNPEVEDYVRIGVIGGSLAAAMLAAIVLRSRNRHYRQVEEEETRDDDADGVPDIYGT